MTVECNRIQSMIEPFLSDELSGSEKQEFIGHVRTCRTCRDELEIYHVIFSLVEELNDDTAATSSDYIKSLNKKLGTPIQDKRKKNVRTGFIVVLGLISIISLIIGIILL